MPLSAPGGGHQLTVEHRLRWPDAEVAVGTTKGMFGSGPLSESAMIVFVPLRPERPSMADHPNLALLQRTYEALGAGDAEFLESVADAGFTVEISGTSAISGTASGVEEAFSEFQRSMELTAGDMSMQPRHMLADDNVGIAIIDVTASRPDGRTIEQQLIHEWRFSDGRISGLREWVWDQAGDVEFWS